MKVFNTLGRQTQPFEPLVAGKVGIYVCGPTVQSEPHLGHGRFAVAFDAIRRYLVWRGFDVTYVQNITDVEDKIIAAAQEAGVDMATLAAEMQKKFRAAYDALNVLRPDIEPRATAHVDEMIGLIETLIEQGLAYPAGGDVYFRVREHDGYAKLSGRVLDDLLAGARVDPSEHKDDPLDFALWKAAKPGEPSWVSPWGDGRPGWHIECSAMSMKYLGNSFDIHGGGSDLIFPHHENELAQSEGATGKTFAKYWLHNGMVNLGGEKMAKSTGHTIDLAGAIARYGGPAVRLFYLRAHYRSPLEFSEELLEDAVAGLERLRAFNRRAGASGSASAFVAPPVADALERFGTAMDDDFGTPEALAVLFDIVREGNSLLDRGGDASKLAAAFDSIVGALGIDLREQGLTDVAGDLEDLAASLGISGSDEEATVRAMLDAREVARAQKDWAAADAVRDGLAKLGIVIEDSADGTRWHRR